MSVNRIVIVGWGRAGKDTAGMMLSAITKIPYAGSTSWVAKELVAEVLGVHPQVAWETRHDNREKWKSICDKIRENNPEQLFVRALRDVGDNELKQTKFMRGIVTGIRDHTELVAVKQLVDRVIWIERPFTPADPTVTFSRADCSDVIYNDGSPLDLHRKLFLWAEKLGLIPDLYLRPTLDKFRE